MKSNIVAKRYAKALFSVAEAKGIKTLDQCSTVLLALSQAFEESLELQKIFHSPVISVTEKMGILKKLLDALKAKPMLFHFFNLLAEKERLTLIPSIATAFRGLLDVKKELVRGSVTTAINLKDEDQKKIFDSLSKKTKKTLQLEFLVNNNLLGGLVLQIGDLVLDASLQTQLVQLQELMTHIEN